MRPETMWWVTNGTARRDGYRIGYGRASRCTRFGWTWHFRDDGHCTTNCFDGFVGDRVSFEMGSCFAFIDMNDPRCGTSEPWFAEDRGITYRYEGVFIQYDAGDVSGIWEEVATLCGIDGG
jgi:hypothetical protein